MSDRAIETLMYATMILLPLSALMARRLPLGATVKMALAWIAIFGVGFVLMSQRDRVAVLFAGSDRSVVGGIARIPMAPDGHYWATVEIDGVGRRMLVDSGATITALSAATAKAAGIKTDGGFPVSLDTANGTVSANRARIANLRIGTIAATDLPAVVAKEFGTMDVLGMNFLSRLKSWRVEGRTLVLEPHAS